MSYLATVKKSSAYDFDHLAKVIEEQNNPNANKPKNKGRNDDRFWKLELDKAKNGYAVIRFLGPAVVDGSPEDVLWQRIWSHGFQGPTGKWYIEKSLTTIGKKDLIARYNSALWNSTKDKDHPNRKIVSEQQKRRTKWVSNIYVVKDPANPENEGKVFLFEYGKKIWDKLQAVMFPKVPGMPQLNPFDPVAGANFNIVVTQVAGFSNYDQSNFSSPAALGSNALIDEAGSKLYSLNELIAPDKFKTEDELASLLTAALGIDVEAAIQKLNAGARAGGDSAAPAVSSPRVSPTVEDDDSPFIEEEEEDDADMARLKSLV